ncbi:uncharacterized protein LOC134234130 [Saccostrea cucullata]|uniref:uncharacterized protein LOC134234130 n=1 Tax=Saccostrea cuccullata TaxID=36930 RepID=UPI002ED4D697
MQVRALKTVSEISAKFCKETKGMTCIFPANCTNSCHGSHNCLQCKVRDGQIIKAGQTLAIQPTANCSDSKMSCFYDTRLHRGMLTWKKDGMLDTCSKPLHIQPGHYPVLSYRSNAITFSEDTRCVGIRECPDKEYNSSEPNLNYTLFDKGIQVWERDCNSAVNNSGRSLGDASKNTLFSFLVFCIFFKFMF